MKPSVSQGSILDVTADAIVNPANSYGAMGGGLAGVIRRRGGQEIEKEAMAKAPIPIGSAVTTTGGDLKFRIIHSPTMEVPGKTTLENVRMAVRAALEEAKKQGFKRIAMPGMGTGVGGLAFEDSAKVMLEEIRSFGGDLEILLVDVRQEMADAWNARL
ncbi:macro domain-containing protein [Candidatus Micrarchaeota archaeon]|nr:macro domain-containing protein [Candidatus Micrarchaeota archaeon]